MNSEVALELPKTLGKIVDAGPLPTSRPVGQEMVPVTDEQLLVALVNGSHEALGLLFGKHARAVYRLAHRILCDETEAADLRQEVFLYLFERAANFDPEKTSGLSWILQITYHRAIDRRRYLSHRHHYQSEVFDETRQHEQRSELSAEHLDGKALLSRLREQLPPDQRKTLELHILEGYSFREIAERSGQTLGNVRHHYYRAIERLRANLFSRTK
ncbi:RNA polymerase sigma factor [Terriglobus sp. TAA 43]|uniref:RNA polymerase sigma factor n=1 Tax=Terriglobus sp. TAA 43 TaxID=278961 RepID=UPI000646A504|nr:sigma-70 family RNA polymerase sigma factor [Terriglobus sp. TAA 43]